MNTKILRGFGMSIRVLEGFWDECWGMGGLWDGYWDLGRGFEVGVGVLDGFWNGCWGSEPCDRSGLTPLAFGGALEGPQSSARAPLPRPHRSRTGWGS